MDISAVHSGQFHSAESERSGGVLRVDSRTALRFYRETATKNPLPRNKVSRSVPPPLPPPPPMPECKLRYIGATVAVAAAAAPAREKENNQECWRAFFLSQRRAHVRPCRPTRAPSHVTVHRRAWRLGCARTSTRRAPLFCRKGAFKGVHCRAKQQEMYFISCRAFSSCHNSRSVPPCVSQIKTHDCSLGLQGNECPWLCVFTV